MGMFDSLYVHGAKACGLLCAEGHPMENIELQTKSMQEDPRGARFHLVHGHLYQEVHLGGFREKWTLIESGASLVVRLETPLVRVERTVEANFYAHCKQCLPVLHETDFSWGSHLGEAYPWVEWIFSFVSGQLMNVAPIRVESREDVRKKFPQAIPDDDRVAKRHFDLLRRAD